MKTFETHHKAVPAEIIVETVRSAGADGWELKGMLPSMIGAKPAHTIKNGRIVRVGADQPQAVPGAILIFQREAVPTLATETSHAG